jgi:hypothetical protein
VPIKKIKISPEKVTTRKFKKINQMNKIRFFIIKTLIGFMFFYLTTNVFLKDYFDFSEPLGFIKLFFILFLVLFAIDVLSYFFASLLFPQGRYYKKKAKDMIRRTFMFIFGSLILTSGLEIYFYFSELSFGSSDWWELLLVWFILKLFLYLLCDNIAERLKG